MIATALLVLLTLVCVAVPWCRLEFRRRASRSHRPMAQELWLQDRDQLLYVEHVDDQGVHLLTFDPSTRQLHRWVDLWPVWHQRLRVRVVWFTRRSAQLTTDVWDAMRT